MPKWDGVGRGRTATELIGTVLFVLGLVVLVVVAAYLLVWVFSDGNMEIG